MITGSKCDSPVSKPDSSLHSALEMVLNWKLARDHVNPPRSSDVEQAPSHFQ